MCSEITTLQFNPFSPLNSKPMILVFCPINSSPDEFLTTIRLSVFCVLRSWLPLNSLYLSEKCLLISEQLLLYHHLSWVILKQGLRFLTMSNQRNAWRMTAPPRFAFLGLKVLQGLLHLERRKQTFQALLPWQDSPSKNLTSILDTRYTLGVLKVCLNRYRRSARKQSSGYI